MNKRLGKILATFLIRVARFQMWRGDRWMAKEAKLPQNSKLQIDRALIYNKKAQLWYYKSWFTMDWAKMSDTGFWPEGE